MYLALILTVAYCSRRNVGFSLQIFNVSVMFIHFQSHKDFWLTMKIVLFKVFLITWSLYNLSFLFICIFSFTLDTVLNNFCKCVYDNELKIKIYWELECWNIWQKEKSGVKNFRSYRENAIWEFNSMVFTSNIIRKDIYLYY